MTFLERETSHQSGLPALLLEFTRTGKAWYLVNLEQPVTFNSHLYVPASFSLPGVSQLGDARAENVEITLPASASICQYLDALTPTESITVRIRKIHMIEDSSGGFSAPASTDDAPTIWVGEIVDISRPTVSSRVLVCNTLALSLARGGLRLSWGRNCPYVLYGRGCNLDKTPFATSLPTVTVLDGVTIQAVELATNGNIAPVPTDILDECSSFTDWTLSPGQAAVANYASIVVLGGSSTFEMFVENNEGNPCYAVRDFGVNQVETANFMMQCRIANTGGNDGGVISAVMGVTETGNGLRVVVAGSPGNNMSLQLGLGNSFAAGRRGTIPETVVAASTAMQINQTYTVKVARTVELDFSVTVQADLYIGADTSGVGGTLVASTSTNKPQELLPLGGFCGPIGEHTDDEFHTAFDRFRVQSPGTLAPASFSGGFIEWNSEPGVLERTGIESVTGDVAKVFGTTHGMELGTNFKVYVGCDRTASTCQKVFRNILNYGGINHMQGKSPFDGQPIF